MEDSIFINTIHPQNCGDSLKILNKTNIKRGSSYLWECEFIKYPFKILAIKGEILRKSVLNPQIEQVEFIDKIHPQNCGDSLKILRKSNIKRGSYFLWECEFVKYSYKCLAAKNTILNGKVLNPLIEENEFIGKEFPQNCGDTLKVLSKSDKYRNTAVYYECEFIKYPYKLFSVKSAIKSQNIDNPNLPYKFKENLIDIIIKNFDKKPTLFELSEFLNIKSTTLGQYIIKYNLRDYISYSYTGLENEVKNFINIYNLNVINNLNIKSRDNKQKEIDIYIQNFNLGIEVNGNYWHSELYKQQNYHQEKSLLAKEKGINLIHIFEYEWLEKQDILKSLIKSKLGIFEKKIGASKCKIKELSYKEYAQFCNQNHLQGECGAKVKLGLFYKEELVQIMSFGVPRFTDKYEWEIIRECSKLGYIILGGKEKLWSYFIKNNNPLNCISYCDFSKFNGNSYLKLGFKKMGLNKPGFVWWDNRNNIIYLRSPHKHKEMKEKYIRIFDAGQLVFIWNK